MVNTRTRRSTATTVLASAGLLLLAAGCTGGDGGATPPPSEPPRQDALAAFDPCTTFSPEQLQSYGATDPGEAVDQGIGEPGCDFEAEGFLLTVYKAPGRGIDYWEGRRANFSRFDSNQVGSRQGVTAITAGSEGQGLCRQILESGGGTVSVAVKYDADNIQGNDPCAKALEIAQQIEPKLPA